MTTQFTGFMRYQSTAVIPGSGSYQTERLKAAFSKPDGTTVTVSEDQLHWASQEKIPQIGAFAKGFFNLCASYAPQPVADFAVKQMGRFDHVREIRARVLVELGITPQMAGTVLLRLRQTDQDISVGRDSFGKYPVIEKCEYGRGLPALSPAAAQG